MKIKDTCQLQYMYYSSNLVQLVKSHQVSQTERNGIRGRCKVPIISIRPPSLNSN